MLGNDVMSKEQLYDLYQQILGVKKFEHQLLYNAMQVNVLFQRTRNSKANFDLPESRRTGGA